jgi:hypothetical protein
MQMGHVTPGAPAVYRHQSECAGLPVNVLSLRSGASPMEFRPWSLPRHDATWAVADYQFTQRCWLGSMVLKMVKVLKVLNISRAGRDSIFTFTRTGLEHPEPAAPGDVLLRGRDALGLARRIEGGQADPAGGGFPAQLARGTRSGR